MSDIKLNSEEWRDVVFEGKNKEYGAYRLRQSSSKRHIVAFLVVLLFAGVMSALPSLVSVVKSLTKSDMGPMDQAYEMTNIPVEPEIPEENILKQETAPPPPPLKSTLKFTVPKIEDDDKVEDNEMVSQTEVQDSKIQISIANVQGTDEEHGLDIAELREHKQIVQEKPVEEKPFTVVEVNPSYPGGLEAMYKFIKDNLNYPVSAQERGIHGRVTVRFVVSKTGEISNVEVLRGIDPSCDKEAIRVVRSMPNWIPGKQNGQNVPVLYTLPINFVLN